MAQYITVKDQQFAIGDTVAVHQQILEGKKTRTQIFEGIVIAIQNREENTSFVVRKIASNSIGVEKIFPIMLPSIEKVVVRRKGDTRRSKLYFLRERIGKNAIKVKEKKTVVSQVA